MHSLSVKEAQALVRKNLDETDPNGSVMYTDDNGDNLSLDDIIAKNLPEAINAVNLSSPVVLLEGKVLEQEDLSDIHIDDDGVLSFSLNEDENFLRFIMFKATDSDVIVNNVIAEGSAEGRKQLNKWLRGRYDRPQLVMLQPDSAVKKFKYYTLKNTTTADNAVVYFIYVEELMYDDDAVEYSIAPRLRQNIIDCLTAMVMETYSDQRAQFFFQKAQNFPNV